MQCNRAEKGIMTDIGSIRRKLRKAYREARRTGRPKAGQVTGWRIVGKQFGIPTRTAWRIAMTDYEPRNARTRHQLGLSVMVEVPACPECGQVHMNKRCPTRRPVHKDLFAMDPEVLRAQLINRECVSDCKDEE